LDESIPHININSNTTTATKEPHTVPCRQSLLHVLHDPRAAVTHNQDRNISQTTSPWYKHLNGTSLTSHVKTVIYNGLIDNIRKTDTKWNLKTNVLEHLFQMIAPSAGTQADTTLANLRHRQNLPTF
jgi:hypothetical protein